MKTISKILNLPRIIKQLIVFLNDVFLSSLSSIFAIFIKFDSLAIPEFNEIKFIIVALLFFIPFYIVFGLYRVIFRFSGIYSLKQIFLANSFYGVFFIFFILLTNSNEVISDYGLIVYSSISTALLQVLIFFVLISISRLLPSAILSQLHENNLLNDKSIKKKNAIVYGAGKLGINIVNLIDNYEVICFVDNDKKKWNAKVDNLLIHSPINLPDLIHNNTVSKIFVTIPKLNSQQRKEILNSLEDCNIGIEFIHSNEDLLINELKSSSSKLNMGDINPRKIYQEENNYPDFRDQNVLITGAGGSIGSELSKQILQLNPKNLILVDNSEFNLFKINQTINEMNSKKQIQVNFLTKLVDICDEDSIKNIYTNYKPNYIFHAAAYKHVELVENNILESVRNNILGTYNLIKNLNLCKCYKFTFISSDKAVRPTNLMGATKRFSEMMIQASNDKKDSLKTIFSIVRFGNVFRSTGSVIPLFDEQIDKGGPITVTDPGATRYFMSVKEAVILVLSSCKLSKGGEVFVLNMGKPINILNIAKKMIKLSGKTIKDDNNVNGDISIKFTGLKNGEKLDEELILSNDLINTNNKDIFMANEKFISRDKIDFIINYIYSNLNYQKEPDIKKIIFENIESS